MSFPWDHCSSRWVGSGKGSALSKAPRTKIKVSEATLEGCSVSYEYLFFRHGNLADDAIPCSRPGLPVLASCNLGTLLEPYEYTPRHYLVSLSLSARNK